MYDEDISAVKHLIERGISAWERSDYKSALDDFQTVLKEHPARL